MRLLNVTFVLSVLVAMTPARADAWFGVLDRLSGPGKFYGALFDVRVACYGKPFPEPDVLELALTKASVQAARVVANFDSNRDLLNMQFAAAQAAWGDFKKAVEVAHGSFPVLSDSDVSVLNARIDALDLSAYFEFNSQVTVAPRGPGVGEKPTEVGKQPPPLLQSPPLVPVGRVAQALRLGAAAVDQMRRANAALNSTGVLVSLCSPRTTRRLALDVAGDLWQANSNPDYANDHTIRLITLVPGLSFRVFRDPRWDFLDVGAGAGMYWFSSRGFDEFSGLVVQPIRFDFRGPSRWVNAGGLKQLAALVTFRAGMTIFPAGFTADAFGATGDKARPIPAEKTFTAAIFVNLTPLLRQPKHVLPIP